MQLLMADESRALQRRIWRQLGDPHGRPGPAPDFLYHDKAPQYVAAAQAIVEAVMPFTKANVLFSGTPFGDGWDRRRDVFPVWRDFYAWRESQGGGGRLYEAPGYECAGNESEELSTLLGFALQLGWDALLAVRPGRNVLWLSHDDRIEFHTGFKHRTLAVKLTKLGFSLP